MSLVKPAPSAIILNASDVLSRRAAPSFMALALAAGSVNVIGLIHCRRYVSHVSGTVTRIGSDFGKWTLMFEYLCVLLAFIAGAMASVLALQLQVQRGRAPRNALGLFAVSTLLAAIALAGKLNVFGASGGHTEEPVDFALMALLAFTMGLMNSTVGSSNALGVRPAHVSGSAADIGVHLGLALIHSGAERQRAVRRAALASGLLAAFATGAALIVPFQKRYDLVALLLPSLVIAGATFRSFRPRAQAQAATDATVSRAT